MLNKEEIKKKLTEKALEEVTLKSKSKRAQERRNKKKGLTRSGNRITPSERKKLSIQAKKRWRQNASSMRRGAKKATRTRKRYN